MAARKKQPPVPQDVADAICFRHREQIIERIEDQVRQLEFGGYPELAKAYRHCGDFVRSLHVEGFSWTRTIRKRKGFVWGKTKPKKK